MHTTTSYAHTLCMPQVGNVYIRTRFPYVCHKSWLYDTQAKYGEMFAGHNIQHPSTYIPHYWIIVRTCMCMIYMQQWDSSHPFCWIHDQRPGNLSMEFWRTTLRSSNVSAWWRSLCEWESGSGGLWSNLVASQLWTFSRIFFQVGSLLEFGNSRTLQDSVTTNWSGGR